MLTVQSTLWEQALSSLQEVWGYETLRDLQGEVVSSLLEQQDTLVLLPTGAGKSLCFQLPALVLGGLTLVVSPLVSLMENQVEELRQRQVPAGLIHSQMLGDRRQQTLAAVDCQELRLLYLSPETLLSDGMWQRLLGWGEQLRALVVDEAHCLVQWGTTFRPVYRRLGAIRPALQAQGKLSHPFTVAAFTATADPKTQQEIERVLQLNQPRRISASPYRANLDLQVAIAWSPAGRRKRLLSLLSSAKGTSGLIYTRSRRDSEALAETLAQAGYRTAAYHAGLGAKQRRIIEQSWLEGQLPFVICTCAFGMGINKPDVRWIVHYHPPLTLSEYVQEIGRAGRDGQRSQVLMLVSEPTGWLDPHDCQQRQYFLEQLQQQQRNAQNLVAKLPQRGHIPTVVRSFPQAEMALSLLHSTQQLTWVDPMHYQIQSRAVRSTPALNTDPIQAMQGFVRTKGCRWQFILESFGFYQAAQGLVCGHCDRCCKSL
jgi:ATP-dependent DNA helicase RecQ